MNDLEKQSRATAIAVPMQTSGVPMYQQEKQGEKCCKCCCDYRRAVIVINIIFIVAGVISILGAITSSQFNQNSGTIDDDTVVKDELKDLNVLNSIISGIGLVASIASLVGAVNYNIYLVAVNVIWMMIQYIASVIISEQFYNSIDDKVEGDLSSPILSYVIQAVVVGLFIYPHVGFIREVKSGIMSRETYPREEYSCCCVSRRY